ncbi:hypothetical protein V5O48_017136 [Marasmius crinis-equi]|uniref:Uncharacterized protein n=1 Tax=Marasmius crinis-equi TaxID=585013 RepID=A0ABR3EPS7_9AGAR
MPELPHYAEDNYEDYPLYNDEKRNGDEAWRKDGLESMEEARKEWRVGCLHSHRFRWDAPHCLGRARIADLVKENSYSTKAMLVLKAMSEVYPALVVRKMTQDFVGATMPQYVADPFLAQTNIWNSRLEQARAKQPLMNGQGDSFNSSKVETGTLRPIIEPLGKSLYVFTRVDHTCFESLEMAYLHTQHVTSQGKKAVVIFSRHYSAAVQAFEEIMARDEDAENDALLEATQESGSGH